MASPNLKKVDPNDFFNLFYIPRFAHALHQQMGQAVGTTKNMNLFVENLVNRSIHVLIHG